MALREPREEAVSSKPALRSKDHLGSPESKKLFIEWHFAEAAPRYDLATRGMSLYRDPAWKSCLVAALPELEEPLCVDMACGTGDVAFLLARKYPRGKIVGLDITEPMLAIARERNPYSSVTFTRQDMNATYLKEESVDIVTGSYALRNAPDIGVAIGEIHRILKPGGVAAFMDFVKSGSLFLQPLQYWLLKAWCGLFGLVLHKNPEIHGYVASSLREYPDRPRLLGLFHDRGFDLTYSRRFFLGLVEIIVIRKRGKGQ